MQEECKSCRDTVHLSEQEMHQIFGSTLRVQGVKLATLADYQARLALCNKCEALQDGITCMHCGCVIQAKAKLQGAKCPYPYAPRW